MVVGEACVVVGGRDEAELEGEIDAGAEGDDVFCSGGVAKEEEETGFLGGTEGDEDDKFRGKFNVTGEEDPEITLDCNF